jgi:hypothetical protein
LGVGEPMKKMVCVFFIAVLFTSAIWIMAIGDGTVDSFISYRQAEEERFRLMNEEERLKSKANIVKYKVKIRLWTAYLKKAEQAGLGE